MSIIAGLIVLWSKAIASIPAGWQLCDGTNGTPDLRDRFVVGAGSIYAVDETGGGLVHDHGFTGDGHTHDLPGGAGLAAGAVLSNTTLSQTVTGTTDFASTLPPFHALAYIMKL